MFVADAHCDTLYSIAVQNMDPEKCMITPERLMQGGVGCKPSPCSPEIAA